MKERTRVLLYLLFATLVVASCSEESSLLAPVPTDTQPTPTPTQPAQVALAGCPSMEQVCAELNPIMRSACPPDSTYKNNGARGKCRRQAFDQAMNPYKRCFSKAEINVIRRCVFDSKPDGHGKGAGNQFESEPVSSE